LRGPRAFETGLKRFNLVLKIFLKALDAMVNPCRMRASLGRAAQNNGQKISKNEVFEA